jgi:hypothetical protein
MSLILPGVISSTSIKKLASLMLSDHSSAAPAQRYDNGQNNETRIQRERNIFFIAI